MVATADQFFDLPTHVGTMSGRGVTIAADSLRWDAAAGRFDQITVIDVQWEGGGEFPIGVFGVQFGDGARLWVRLETAAPPEVAAYRAFVLAFLDALGPERRARIVFRRHSPPIGVAMSVIFLVPLAGILIWALASGAAFSEPEAWLIIPGLGLYIGFFVLALRHSLRYAPRPLDPATIPIHLLPPA